MKMFIKLLLLSVVIAGVGSLAEVYAKWDCPPMYECALVGDVVAGKANCPDGYTCDPVIGAPGCPSYYVCFIKRGSGPAAPASETPAHTGPFISSVDPFPLYPGSTMKIYGENLGASSTLVLTNGSLMVNISQDSIKKDSGVTYIITATLPSFVVPGSYFLYFDFGGTKSNNASIFVKAGSPVNSSNTTPDTNTTPVTNVPSPILTYPAVSNPLYTNDVYPETIQNNQKNKDVVIEKDTQTETSSGTKVRTTDNLRVRSTPSIYGALITTQPLGTPGTIKDGPISADGYSWWNVDYETGADGWSVGSYLREDITGGNSSCFTFANNLSFGSSHADMFYLQTALAAEGFSISSDEKTPTPYFGNSTLVAAKAFQVKYAIYPQAGYVGPLTRTRLNAIYGCR